MATTIPGGEFLTGTLNVLAQSLLLPVMILLIIFIIFAIIEIGALIAEYTGRKKISGEEKEEIIKKIAQCKTKEQIADIVYGSEKLKSSDKELLNSIIELDDTYNKNTREVLARNLLESYESKLVGSLMTVDIVAKVGSGCGLLGTIIPMGPGLAALGAGDMITLTTNLTTAFNTTTAGLAAGTICFVIAKIRRKWYNEDMTMLYDIAETILEVDCHVPQTQ